MTHRFYLLTLLCFLSSSCQIGYILNSGYNQFSMMANRESVDNTLKKNDLTTEQKRKLELSQKAKQFAIQNLHLKKTDNYSTFINLKRPYVTWVVQASEKWQFKNYQWWFPFLGNVPYKGYFTEKEAFEEAAELEKKGFDTYVRGVSAYSTLGYFSDSVLSSMLRYKDHDLVNTIIHETVHTTIYVKSNADFNERLAVFIGNKGTEIFYKNLEGENSETVKMIQNENTDDQLFSKFISSEIKNLEAWYTSNPEKKPELREQQFQLIKDAFKTKLSTQLKTKSYERFQNEKLNNAYLGLYKTYLADQNDFEDLYKRCNSDLITFINKIKTLENSKDPSQDMKSL